MRSLERAIDYLEVLHPLDAPRNLRRRLIYLAESRRVMPGPHKGDSHLEHSSENALKIEWLLNLLRIPELWGSTRQSWRSVEPG